MNSLQSTKKPTKNTPAGRTESVIKHSVMVNVDIPATGGATATAETADTLKRDTI